MMTKISVLFAAFIWAAVPSQAVVIHSVCPSGCDYPDPGTAEAALPSIVPTWPVLNDTYIFNWEAGQVFTETLYLYGAQNAQAYFVCTANSSNANLSCPKITDPLSSVTVTSGMTVTGWTGLASGTTVSSVSGTGPYTVTLSSAPTLATGYCSTGAPPCQTCTAVGNCTQLVTLLFGTAHWIIHRSSQSCAAPGTRAGKPNTTLGPGGTITPPTGMAAIVTPSGRTPAIISGTTGISYHRFECIEAAESTATNQQVYQVVALAYQPAGSPGFVANQYSKLSHHNVLNQVYLHDYLDPVSSNFAHSLWADSAYLEVTNSTLMAFHRDTESHAIAGTNWAGPLYFRNNEFETSQIGTIFGGGGEPLGGSRATGVQILGNYYYTPWLWRVTSGTANPANTFSPSTCMYDSNGGESFINATSGHWWLCVGGTWTDQGVGTPSQPYCQTAACTAGGATNLVCSAVMGSTTVTCPDTTGIASGMYLWGPGHAFYTNESGVSVQTVSSGSFTTNVAANSTTTGIVQFIAPSVLGAAVTPYCPAGCSIDKNHWECKDCFGVWSDGNVIQNAWQPAMLSQYGQCMLFNQVDSPFDVESYLTFTNNSCDSNAVGLIIGANGAASWNHISASVVFRNNLLTNIGLPQLTGETYNNATTININNYLHTVWDHNTLLLNTSIFGQMGHGWLTCFSVPNRDLAWSSNVANVGYASWYDDCGSLGDGATVLRTDYATSDFGHSVIINNQTGACSPGGSGNCGQTVWSTAPCNGCSYPTSFASTFQSYPSNLAVSSPYQGTGYLGTDPGADIQVVNWSTQGAASGAPNPYLDFRVRSLSVSGTTAVYYYTAPDTGACTLSIAINSGYISPVYNSSDGGGNPDRSVTVTGLSPHTRYWYKFVCGASNYRRSDVFFTE
jgi:hypothetical protein